MRTVPSSRANSSKQSRAEQEQLVGQSKRSRSASEEPWAPATAGLEIRGSESQIHREAEAYGTPTHQPSRPRRLTKVRSMATFEFGQLSGLSGPTVICVGNFGLI